MLIPYVFVLKESIEKALNLTGSLILNEVMSVQAFYSPMEEEVEETLPTAMYQVSYKQWGMLDYIVRGISNVPGQLYQWGMLDYIVRGISNVPGQL